MSRAVKRTSGMAKIPSEALLSLRPHVDSACSNTGSIENQIEIVNHALIPRYDILQKVISAFCHCDISQYGSSRLDSDQSADQPLVQNRLLTLRGMGGLGKTMLAGMVVSFTDLRSTFDHILWLNLGIYFKQGSIRNNISYSMYLDCLQKLCQQLNVSAELKSMYFPNLGDSKMKISSKFIQAFEQSKLDMSKIIDGLNILIVLDDVWSHEDVELFNFGEHVSSLFSILVTTRILDQEPSSSCLSIDVGLMSQDEGRYLFSIEAGLERFANAQDNEAVDCILKKCGYLPLAIRTAGRLVKASRKIGPELNTLDILEIVIKMSDSPRMSPVTELLDRSFSFVTNEFASFALKLLFSAFAVVFRRDDILRPWVNLGDIHIVWKALICSHDMIQLQLRSSLREYKLTKIEQIADLMFVMGLLDRKCGKRSSEFHQQKSYRVHHDLMWDYGKMFCSLFRTFDGELVKCEQHGIACCNVCFEGSLDFIFNENNKKWNGIIVEYFQSSAEIKNAKSYELKWLPLHMMKAGLFHEAFDLLTTEEFLENQIEANGIEDGICFMISLVRSYEKMYIADSFPSKTPMITILLHINDFLFRFSSLVQLDDTFKREIGHGIILLGLELQKFSKLLKSIDIFENALNVFSTITCEESDPDIAYALKLIDSCATHNLVLVRQDSPNKLKLKVQDVLNNVQNKTNLCFELSSHPGYTIVEMECKCKFTGIVSYEGVYLGVGSKDNSLMLNYDGQMIRDATCRRTFFAALGCLAEGFPLQLISDFQFGCFIKEHEQVEKVMKCLNAARLYAIADDGSVYPKMAPHLCLGVLYFQSLILVANHSSNRAVFKYYSKLQCSKISNIDNEGKNENNDRSILSSPNADGILLELSSHPGMGIVLLNQASSVPLINGALIGGLAIGPVQHALSAKMNEKNHLMITNYNNGLAFTSGLKENLDIGKNIYISDLLGPWINEFVINDDGTISPLHAKELVFGF